MRKLENILVTGGAGFIGSNFIRGLLGDRAFDARVINLDALTYAGNLESLADVEDAFGGGRYFFEKADIRDAGPMAEIFKKYDIDTVVHFAAESHVDRSITGPGEFIGTNILGTYTLLETARGFWKDRDDVLFHHVSTDEVYGSLGAEGAFTETTAYDPRSPYSASKASSDHLVMAYHHTYGLPVTLSNCSNNYGPYQFPEKLIPLIILNILDKKPLPVYGDGKQIRDWIHVEDHNTAVRLILKKGGNGEKYNIGGESERENIWIVQTLCDLVAQQGRGSAQENRRLITYVKDRPGHDRRYAVDCDKIKAELGWRRSISFQEGLAATISWYLSHEDWVTRVKSGAYRDWLRRNYESR